VPVPARPGGVGRVSFIVLAMLLLAAPATAGGYTTTPRLGSHAMVGPNMPPEHVDALFGASGRAHLSIVRADVHASAVFPLSPDEPRWESVDTLRGAARTHRLQVLGVLSGVPLWLARCPPVTANWWKCPPADYAAWGRTVERIVERAPEIGYWEIVNEANLSQQYFYGDALEYAKFLRATSAAIRRANPKAKVVFTGVVGFGPWLDKVLSQPGVAGSFDVANAHFRGGIGKLDDMVRRARADYRTHGFNGPLWVTEMGYPSDIAYQWDPGFRGTEWKSGFHAQADYMRHAIRALMRAGAARVFVTLRDTDGHWGLFSSEGLIKWPLPGVKAAYAAVRRIAGRMARRYERRRTRTARLRPGT